MPASVTSSHTSVAGDRRIYRALVDMGGAATFAVTTGLQTVEAVQLTALDSGAVDTTPKVDSISAGNVTISVSAAEDPDVFVEAVGY